MYRPRAIFKEQNQFILDKYARSWQNLPTSTTSHRLVESPINPRRSTRPRLRTGKIPIKHTSRRKGCAMVPDWLAVAGQYWLGKDNLTTTLRSNMNVVFWSGEKDPWLKIIAKHKSNQSPIHTCHCILIFGFTALHIGHQARNVFEDHVSELEDFVFPRNENRFLKIFSVEKRDGHKNTNQKKNPSCPKQFCLFLRSVGCQVNLLSSMSVKSNYGGGSVRAVQVQI